MKGVAQEELHDDLPCAELTSQPPKPGFVGICGRSYSQLVSEFLSESLAKADCRLKIDTVLTGTEAQRYPQVISGQPLHSNQNSAATSFAAGPPIHQVIDQSPTPQVEIADTKVPPVGNGEGVAQRRNQLRFDIVEDPWHDDC